MNSVVLPFWLNRPPMEALDIARIADASGFDELWVGEMMTFDAFALAGAIARETRTVRLVVGPLAIGLRDPASLALGIASVATLGGRPADLALGASTPMVVSQWHGRPWVHTVAHMREAIPALRTLLAGERAALDGVHVQSQGFRLQVGAQTARIAVAAFAPRMVEVAATLADRVVVNLVTPGQVSHLRDQVGAAARAARRPAPPIVVWVPTALDPGHETWTQLARQLVVYLAPPGYGEMFSDAGFGEIVARARSGEHPRELLGAIPRDLVHAVAAVGDFTAIRERLDDYLEAGADEVAVVPTTAEDPGAARLLAGLRGKG